MSAPLSLSLSLLLAATLVVYAGTRLLWSAVAWPGLRRGAVMALPLVALTLYQAPAAPGTAVAMLVSAAVLAVTLGLGVSTVDLPVDEADGSPMLRLLLPLAAATCLAGFHGNLAWWHAVALAAVGGLTFWTADGERRTPAGECRTVLLLPAASLLAGGLALVAYAIDLFAHVASSAAHTPVIVLLAVPAVLLALLGLLTAEAREHTPDTPHETAVGLFIACLGFGLPAVIAVSLLTPKVMKHVAATQPTAWPAPVMPLATWRIDSVLLVVVSILLLPIGFGRFRVGRLEGAWLILVYLVYAAVATRVGATTG